MRLIFFSVLSHKQTTIITQKPQWTELSATPIWAANKRKKQKKKKKKKGTKRRGERLREREGPRRRRRELAWRGRYVEPSP